MGAGTLPEDPADPQLLSNSRSVTGSGFFFTLENTMSDNTKIAIGLIVGAPAVYFLLVVLMSF
jgi:hypothetical protein